MCENEIETPESSDHEESIYLCGNSLGLQPRLTAIRLQQYLTTWKIQGVFGHFRPLDKSPLPVWLHADAEASESIAPIVGALASEVAVMETLTANLHLLMAAFYRPDINGRHKIIIESKAFPSDHVSERYPYSFTEPSINWSTHPSMQLSLRYTTTISHRRRR